MTDFHFILASCRFHDDIPAEGSLLSYKQEYGLRKNTRKMKDF